MADGAFVVGVSLPLAVDAALRSISPSILCLFVPVWERCYPAIPVLLEAKCLFGHDGWLADRAPTPNLQDRR